MGHSIVALIGPTGSVEPVQTATGAPRSSELPFGLSIVGLREEQIDRLAGDQALFPFNGFIYLGPPLAEGVARKVGAGQLLYVETNYFGGMGDQGAALFEAGKLVWREHMSESAGVGVTSLIGVMVPGLRIRHSKSPISRGLSLLGVPPPLEGDEFDAMGLSRFRSCADLGYEWDD